MFCIEGSRERRHYIRSVRRSARDRYLELAPKHWRATRAKLNPDELDSPLSAFEIPPAVVTAATAEITAVAGE